MVLGLVKATISHQRLPEHSSGLVGTAACNHDQVMVSWMQPEV